jgi:hypothetical protein
MRAASPVFVVGEARSGSSPLYRTLQKHPSFRPKAPQKLVETRAFDHLRRAFLFTPECPVTLRRCMLDGPCAYAVFLRSICPPGLPARSRRRSTMCCAIPPSVLIGLRAP